MKNVNSYRYFVNNKLLIFIGEPCQIKANNSYMDFFVNNCTMEALNKTQLCPANTIKAKLVVAIKGTCTFMCPEDEVNLRKKERMVHILEIVGNKQKLVKQYSRPAADTNLAIAHNLRPYHVLKETVDYLLFEVTKRTDATSLVIYNFVTDRLRAVRQDMIIQDLNPEFRITLLEPMIRFHIYYGYLLCETHINDYSPTLNRNILLECLTTCLFCYDELELKNVVEKQNINLLINDMVKCSLEEKNEEPFKNRELIEALYVLTNLYNESPMWRFGRLSENVRHAPTVRLAYKLAAAALYGHYVKVCKSIEKLCPLMFCSVAMFLPKLQRRAVQVVSVAYSCRGRHVPLHAVRSWLCAGDEEEARIVLRHYGLTETDGRVYCLRESFRYDAPLLPPKKISAAHLEGMMNMVYIMTYTPHYT